jgi:hypothetical protein
MRPLRRGLVLLLLGAPLAAQLHSRTGLVLGQSATLSTTSPTDGLLAVFALSFTGLGAGPCLPPHGCLSVLPPLLASPLVAPATGGGFAFDFVLPPDLLPAPLATQALVLTPTQVLLSNALSGPIEPLSSFDDDFDGHALSPAWQVHNPQLVDLTVGNGGLHLRPLAGGPAATWYGNGEGPLVHRLVRGDFTVIATLRAYRSSNAGTPLEANYNMGGVSLRDPRSDQGPHDWLHVSVGGGIPSIPIAAEDKSTDDSQSDLRLHAIAAPQGQVRATRQGAQIGLYYRATANEPWTLLRTHFRPDLGPELQVGPIAYSWSRTVDVVVSFDRIQFSRP